ncbi:hypothetical protein BHE74_00024203, partial [Ensete ventricosum]
MYRSASKLVCGPPATGRYHRLGLFPPRYHPKLAGNDQFRPSPPVVVRYQPREKEEEGEERENLEIRCCSLSTIPIRHPRRGFVGRISFVDCREKKTMFLLPTRGEEMRAQSLDYVAEASREKKRCFFSPRRLLADTLRGRFSSSHGEKEQGG